MKKIFLIAVVLLMMINFIINYHHEVTKEKHTPMADFKTKVEMAPMKEYNDPDFGYVVKYPCFFQQESADQCTVFAEYRDRNPVIQRYGFG